MWNLVCQIPKGISELCYHTNTIACFRKESTEIPGTISSLYTKSPGDVAHWMKIPDIVSCVWLFATPWTIAHQAPMSMGFSRQEYWSGLPCCPPGDLPGLGTEPTSLTFVVLAGRFFATSATWEAHLQYITRYGSLSLNLFSFFLIMANRWGNSGWLYFLGLPNHCRWWLQPWN